MHLAERFQQALPGVYFLDEADPASLQNYLHEQGWIDPEDSISNISKPGEGNMNKVLRVQTQAGCSFIIKQSRPWAEKFPDIAAPAERANVEAEYFQNTAKHRLVAACSPALLNADPNAHILQLEDLGDAADMSTLYQDGRALNGASLASLLAYLSALHSTFTRDRADFYIENLAMRSLNAEHIFHFPFVADNGLNLDEITPGLSALAETYRSNTALMAQVDALHKRYLNNGGILVHGDFYPGSFLKAKDGIKVIDTEFCFFGDAEFDLGVFHAHMLMAQQPESIISGIQACYAAPANFSAALYQKYTGIEILRRLLGLAQLPLALNLEQKAALLEQAAKLLLTD